jgi:pilus assembly protein FimV
MAFKRWHYVAGLSLVVAATAASALSLGRSRGAVLLGRGLDVTVLASVEAQETTPEAGCFFSEIFYGDSRVAPNQVSVSVERASPTEVRVRVRANTAVDEPVVTLYLRSSCGGNYSRRYVLLADSPSETDNNANVVVPFAVPSSPARTAGSGTAAQATAPTARAEGQSAAEVAAADRAKNVRDQRRAEREARRTAQREASALPAGQPQPEASAPAQRLSKKLGSANQPVATGKPRLKIDLTDLTGRGEPSLRTSSELLSTPSADANIRAQAMALWNSINVGPEEALREAQRVQALEAQLKQAMEQGKRQSQEITALTTQLKEAKQARYLNPFTILLGLLSLLGVGTALWLVRRGATFSSASKPWWGSEKRDTEEQKLWEHLETGDSLIDGKAAGISPLPRSGEASGQAGGKIVPAGSAIGSGMNVAKITLPSKYAAGATQAFKASGSQPVGAAFSNSAQPDFDLSSAEDNPQGALTGQNQASKRHSGFSNSEFNPANFPGARVADAEDLFDIQEQADFFLSLGQPDQAIEVLTNHISDNVETSALAYMDLFDIYHRFSREKQYNELREEFNRVFNAQVPVFSNYNVNPRGLEDYPLALKSIQDLWPSAGVLEVIEESIFRKPDNESKPFDMLAYRELMLLYTLAKEIDSSSFAPLSSTPLGPLSTSTATEMAGLEPLSSSLASMQASLDDEVNFSLEEPAFKAEPTVSLTAAQTAKLAQQANAPGTKKRAADDHSLDFDLSDFGSEASDEADAEIERQLREKLGQPGKKNT